MIDRELFSYFFGNMQFSEYLVHRLLVLIVFVISLICGLFGWYLTGPYLADVITTRDHIPQLMVAVRLLTSFAIFFAVYLACAAIVNFYRRASMRGVIHDKLEFNAHGATEISHSASIILKRHLPDAILGAIDELRKSSADPYLVIRGLVPVPLDFPIKPAVTRPRELGKRMDEKERRWTRIIDSTAGGLLHLLGAEPGPRFADDEEDERLVVDRFTRTDIQELPDMQQDDIFLRFHQSTIERPFDRICAFKTYTALSNMRAKPIFLLRVRDIIECLENKNGVYSQEEHDEIFFQSPNLEKERKRVVELLMEDKYQRDAPRAIRFLKGDKDAGRRIVRKVGDDYIMAFDAARVWVHSSGSSLHKEAILALRGAIHQVSRKKLYEIKLRKRDVLIVDNLRAMVARREDAPFVGWIDILITVIHKFPHGPDFSGWWLREAYGYPSGAKRGVKTAQPNSGHDERGEHARTSSAGTVH